MVIAIDSSGSIGEENYYTMLGFTKSFVSALNIDSVSGSMVGVETFANNAQVEFDVDAFETKELVLNALSFPYSRGTTNTASALSTMRSMFDKSGSQRDKFRKVGILITDGESNNREDTFQEAVTTRGENITLLSVAVDIKVRKLQVNR